MVNPIYKKIYQKIKKYDTIVVARHIGPDPDAVTTEIALRDSIRETFPNKKVYAVGSSVARFKTYGTLDKINEDELVNPLLIVVDVPNIYRIDGITFSKYNEVIKIDHHPFEDKMGDVELVDTTSCSAAQLVTELIFNTKLKMPLHVAERLSNAADAIIALDHEMSSVRDEIMDAQNSSQTQSNLVKDILLSIENLYKISNKREVEKIQDEFLRVFRTKDLQQLARFHRQLDIIAEGYRAQSVSF